MSERAGLVALALLVSVGCGTPSRRLPARMVDDPITLPRRMVSVAMGAQRTASNERRETEWQPIGYLRYGLTDRLTLDGLLALDFAVLDDAPIEYAATGERAARSPFGLSLQAGLAGIGYSSIEGTIVQPRLGLVLRKRLGNSWRAGLGAAWYSSYSDLRDYSALSSSASLTVQLTQTLALTGFVVDTLDMDTFAPSSRWNLHTVSAGLAPGYRPLHWLTLELDVQVQAVWRPLLIARVVPPTEPGPLPVRWPSRRFPVFWAGAAAAAHW